MAHVKKPAVKFDRNGKPFYGGKKKGFQINGSSIKVIAERARYQMVYSEWHKAFVDIHGEKKYSELTIQLGFTVWCYIVNSPGTPKCVRDYLTKHRTIPEISKQEGKKGSKVYINTLSNYFRTKIREDLFKGRDIVMLLNAPNTKQDTKDQWNKKILDLAKQMNVTNFNKDTASKLHQSIQSLAKNPERTSIVHPAIARLNNSKIKLTKEVGKIISVVNDARLMEIFVYLPMVVSETYQASDKYFGRLGKNMQEDLNTLFYVIKVLDAGNEGLRAKGSKNGIDKITSETGRKLVQQAKKILGLG